MIVSHGTDSIYGDEDKDKTKFKNLGAYISRTVIS